MAEEVFSGFRLAAASAQKPFGFEVRLVGAEVASAGRKPSEQRRLAAPAGRDQQGCRRLLEEEDMYSFEGGSLKETLKDGETPVGVV